MKLPLSTKKEGHYCVVTDADEKTISDSFSEIEEEDLEKLVAYANAYHRLHAVIENYTKILAIEFTPTTIRILNELVEAERLLL